MMEKEGSLSNSFDHKVINLAYARTVDGVWTLVGMDKSEGVSDLIQIPDFDPQSPEPRASHLKGILDALAKANRDGGRIYEGAEGSKYVVTIEMETNEDKPRKIEHVNGGPDTDADALRELQRVAKERMKDAKRFGEFYKEVQLRATDPAKLSAAK
jgi:hypothetical protein